MGWHHCLLIKQGVYWTPVAAILNVSIMSSIRKKKELCTKMTPQQSHKTKRTHTCLHTRTQSSHHARTTFSNDLKQQVSKRSQIRSQLWINLLSVSFWASQSDFSAASRSIWQQHETAALVGNVVQFWSNWPQCSIHAATAIVYKLAVASCVCHS